MSNKSFDRRALFALVGAARADGIRTDCGWDDESLSIVHNEGRESFRRAFDSRLFALDEIEHVDSAARIVGNRARKPMPASLDKLQFVKSGALLTPAIAFAERFKAIDQLLLYPFRRAIPLNIGCAVLDINSPWPPV